MVAKLCRSAGISCALMYVVASLVSGKVHARAQYLDQWQTIYPQSTSSDANCQLCHQSTAGGNGWNQYGWAIREIFLDERAINGGDDAAALDVAVNELGFGGVVHFDRRRISPLDQNPITFLDEIRYNTQPGWVAGADNTINFLNGSVTTNQLPPSYPALAQTENELSVTEVEGPGNVALPQEPTLIELSEVANGFNAPVKAVRAPGIDGSIFVVEQRGRVIRVDLATGEKTVFLDVSAQLVAPRAGFDERGLLGLAFHPDFETNGLFYTYQSEPVRPEQTADFTTLPPNVSLIEHRSMVVEYRASDSSCNSPIDRQKTLIMVDQPQFNHNGGDLAFGPDGYLYVSFGDGGGADDQAPETAPVLELGHGLLGNGRDNTNPLGSILRIDVAGSNSDNGQYGIPVGNPFNANGDDGLDEIFAYGFRNPYRFSFDRLCFQAGQTCNTLITADVGQGSLEEVDIVIKGGNYGWNWKEGSLFFIDPVNAEAFVTSDEPPGVPNDLIEPIGQYGRDIGISTTGGYIYRGEAISSLTGRYVFADFFRPSTDKNLLALDPRATSENQRIKEFNVSVEGNITGFGQDSEGELYIVTNASSGNPLNEQGTLQKLLPLGASYSSPIANDESAVCPASDDLCVPIRAENGNIAMVCL